MRFLLWWLFENVESIPSTISPHITKTTTHNHRTHHHHHHHRPIVIAQPCKSSPMHRFCHSEIGNGNISHRGICYEFRICAKKITAKNTRKGQTEIGAMAMHFSFVHAVSLLHINNKMSESLSPPIFRVFIIIRFFIYIQLILRRNFYIVAGRHHLHDQRPSGL